MKLLHKETNQTSRSRFRFTIPNTYNFKKAGKPQTQNFNCLVQQIKQEKNSRQRNKKTNKLTSQNWSQRNISGKGPNRMMSDKKKGEEDRNQSKEGRKAITFAGSGAEPLLNRRRRTETTSKRRRRGTETSCPPPDFNLCLTLPRATSGVVESIFTLCARIHMPIKW